MAELNDKHREVLSRMAEGWTNIEAWQSQYPTSKYNSAAVSASDLLARPEAQDYLKEAKSRVAAKVQKAFQAGINSAQAILNNPTAFRTQFGPTFKIIKELAVGPTKVELTGKDGGPIQFDPTKIADLGLKDEDVD